MLKKRCLFLFLSTATQLMGLQASAAVVDSFTCRLEYSSTHGNVQGISRRLTAVRTEVERKDLLERNIKFTEAESDKIEFEFFVDGKRYSADLVLRYFHATEFGADGQAIRAAQSQCHQRCVILPGSSFIDGCNPGWFEDPFAGQAWHPVEIASSGFAQFDISSLPIGHGALGISCELLGSEEQ